jgi:hypothetical protein
MAHIICAFKKKYSIIEVTQLLHNNAIMSKIFEFSSIEALISRCDMYIGNIKLVSIWGIYDFYDSKLNIDNNSIKIWVSKYVDYVETNLIASIECNLFRRDIYIIDLTFEEFQEIIIMLFPYYISRKYTAKPIHYIASINLIPY